MKKLATSLLVALTILSLVACNRTDTPSSLSQAESNLEDMLSSSSQASNSSQNSGTTAVDEALVRGAILNFGAVEEPNDEGKAVTRPSVVSLFYLEEFTKETLTPGDIFSWYFSYSMRESLTTEERAEKYKNPLGEDMGWFFPADLYESAAMTYFDVTTEFLRSDSTYYNAEHKGYTVDTGPGVGNRPDITLKDYDVADNLVKINLNFADSHREHQDMTLTIRLTDEAYQYVSYLPQA